MGMMKKQSIVALVLLLLIPLVRMLGGILFSLINPEIAAGHPNYVQNYHRLSLLKNMCRWASAGLWSILWMLVCFLVIRSKKRSHLWLFLAALGPFGFAVLAMLNDRAPAETRQLCPVRAQHERVCARGLRTLHLRRSYGCSPIRAWSSSAH